MRPDDGVLGGSETFRERLRGQSATMLAEAQEARYFDHDATRGVDREHIVRKRLDQFLPARYGVTTGEVRAANDEVSGQWDVLVYNRLDTPVMYSPHYTSASSVVPIEGVLAAISVRSKLDKDGIEDAAAAASPLSQCRATRSDRSRRALSPWCSPLALRASASKRSGIT